MATIQRAAPARQPRLQLAAGSDYGLRANPASVTGSTRLSMVLVWSLCFSGCLAERATAAELEAMADATSMTDTALIDAGAATDGDGLAADTVVSTAADIVDSASSTLVDSADAGDVRDASASDAPDIDAQTDVGDTAIALDAGPADACATLKCDDKHPCTKDSCVKGACVYAPDNKACDDGEVCTNDSCDVKKGCINPANEELCDDGDACTKTDLCKDGKCQPGADSCPCKGDGECAKLTSACAKGSCSAGKCVKKPVIGACDDGDACTGGDACAAGVCAGKAKDCSSLDGPCAKGQCGAGTCSAKQLAGVCDDGDACTSGDGCSGGVCKGKAKDCSSLKDKCNGGVCKAGGCVAVPLKLCDDGNPCTTDSCDGAKGCVHTTLASNSSCGVSGICSKGVCVGSPGNMSGLQKGAPWPMFNGGPTHQGRSTAIGPQTAKLKWKLAGVTGSWSASPMVAADGTIYIGGAGMKAITPAGVVKWTAPTKSSKESTPAIGANGTVYIGSNLGTVSAISPAGKKTWTLGAFASRNYVSAPAINAAGTVFLGSYDGYVNAVSPGGKLQWKFLTGTDATSSPAIGVDGTIYVGGSDHYLYALDGAGKEKWKVDLNAWIGLGPSVGVDGAVYIGVDKTLFAVDPAGKIKWTFAAQLSTSVSHRHNGGLVFGASDGLYSIDAKGKQVWKFPVTGISLSSPLLDAKGTAYFGSMNGYLYAIDSSGKEKWKYQVGQIRSSVAMAADGTLYVGAAGTLYAMAP